MAAPSPTARVESGGLRQLDPFPTKVTIAADTNIAFWERAVTPSGYEGGDPIETTTMFNAAYRTFAPRELITVTNTSITAAYDPLLYTELLTVINKNTEITITFPDGSTVAFWGYVKTAEPQEMAQEGDEPEIAITIVATNYDNANHVEAGPAISEVAGTP